MKPADNRQKKSATRLYAVQALFQMEASDTDAEAVQAQIAEAQLQAADASLQSAEVDSAVVHLPIEHIIGHPLKGEYSKADKNVQHVMI